MEGRAIDRRYPEACDSVGSKRFLPFSARISLCSPGNQHSVRAKSHPNKIAVYAMTCMAMISVPGA